MVNTVNFLQSTSNSNTTLVKVKYVILWKLKGVIKNSNTTLVKVKLGIVAGYLVFTETFKYNTC